MYVFTMFVVKQKVWMLEWQLSVKHAQKKDYKMRQRFSFLKQVTMSSKLIFFISFHFFLEHR